MRKQERQRRIAREIFAERRRQDRQWGGIAHDDQHSASDWCAFMVRAVMVG